MRVLGIISGTSLDAIDVAIVDIQAAEAAEAAATLELTLLAHGERPWPDALRSRLAAWLAEPDAAVPLGELAEVDMAIGRAFADAARTLADESGIDADSIDLVASHGQTLHHRIGRDGRAVASLQAGQPAVLAEELGATVVADFRPRDIAAGGEGAPLVALLDLLAFGDPDRDVAVLNLGGIANVTVIPAGRPEAAVAWDTGPGNAVLDALARRLLGEPHDADGRQAASGIPSAALLDELLGDPWFAQPPPKSTGRERFGDGYATAFIDGAAGLGLTTPDIFATATALTARTVARALGSAPAWPSRCFVGGGGTRNPTLRAALAAALADAAPPGGAPPSIEPVEAAGIPSGAKEAIAFALIGHETLHGRPGSLPGATGARHPSVLGAIWPGKNAPDLLGLPRVGSAAGPPRRVVVRAAAPAEGVERPWNPD